MTTAAVVAAYFGLLLGVSWIASRRAGSTAFFNGDRRMPWPVVALAMVGSAISGVTFVSVPGMVVAKNYSYLQMVLGFVAGYVVIGYVLVPLFYRLNLLSIYGYLEERFSRHIRLTGAFFFVLSKLLGAGVRFFVVCAVLQLLIFGPIGVPFAINVTVTVALIWLYTVRGGVSSLIWTDLLKSACLVMSVVMAIWFTARSLHLDAQGMAQAIADHPSSRVFHFDDPRSPIYFWKQFVAGAFLAIAMNGLDQDMMQRHLACADPAASRKNMIVSAVMQVGVIALFLILGTSLAIYVERSHMTMPAKSDELFGMVATSADMPPLLGVVFVVGLVSAAYSAAGSALTSLTTSVSVDLLAMAPERLTGWRKRLIHACVSAAMALFIILFWHFGSDDAISAVYTLASYTYGPLLGLFAFGIFTRHRPGTAGACAACMSAPLISWAAQWGLAEYAGYHMGVELLLLNAAITMAGLRLASISSPITVTANGTRPS